MPPIFLAALIAALAAGCAPGFSRLPDAGGHAQGSACAPPPLAGTPIGIDLVGMGMSIGMMGRSDMSQARMTGDGQPMMRLQLVISRSHVTAGRVSFVATNTDAMSHELVVIRLGNRAAGDLRVGTDGTADETGKVAEASRSCGEGPGNGIAPATAGWVTADLASGNYVVVCNEPGHYAAGMYAQLSVG